MTHRFLLVTGCPSTRAKNYETNPRTELAPQKLRNEPKAAHPGCPKVCAPGCRMIAFFYGLPLNPCPKLRNEPNEQGASGVGQAVSPANFQATKRKLRNEPKAARPRVPEGVPQAAG
jgi:hypothetical protein